MTMDNEFFLADGEEAKKRAEEPNAPTQKTKYLKITAGESRKVVLLDIKFPSYYGHGDYNLKVPSHLCTAPREGMPCRSCDAGIKRSMKYLIPFYDLEAKELMWFDTTKKHVAAVYSAIDEYGEDILTTPFVLKRTGSGAQDTSYSFMPMSPKQQKDFPIPADVKPFEAGSQERSDAYNSVLRPPTSDYLDKIIAKANGAEVASVEQGNDYNF